MRMLLMLGWLLLGLPGAASAAEGVPPALQPLAWLLGNWERTGLPDGSRGYEHWELEDGAFIGIGTKLKHGQVVFEERLRLEAGATGVSYVADVAENARPVRFRLIQQQGRSAVFENAAHDFPKRIAYRLEGDRLEVTTSGDGKETVFRFERAPAGEAATVEQRPLRANAAVRDAWATRNSASLSKHYADDGLLMPEHSVARRGQPEIAAYYAALFDALQVEDYKRTSHDIVVYGEQALQTGQYSLDFSTAAQPRRTFDGKFMALWDLRGAEPRLVCELWGADAPFDRAAWPEITPPAQIASRPAESHTALLAEVSSRNALIDTLVTERRGAEHAQLFLPDAIYLTYYTPMRVGMAQIRDYFVEHEKPGDVTIESLDLDSGKLHRLQGDDVVLEEGFYRVGWQAGDARGVVNGKSLNVWKRNADGTLQLFRQAVNHD